jgi:hypothetical protein
VVLKLAHYVIVIEDDPHPTKTEHLKIMEAAETVEDKIKEADEGKDATGVGIR